MGDHLRHAAAEQGQEEHLVHAGEAAVDALGKGGDGQISQRQADNAGGEDADDQHQKDVQADGWMPWRSIMKAKQSILLLIRRSLPIWRSIF